MKFSTKTIPSPDKKRRRGRVALFFIGGLFLAIGASVFLFELYYKTRVYPGVLLSNRSVSGITERKLKDQLAKFINELESKGIVAEYQNKKVTIFPHVISADDPDLAYELFAFDSEGTTSDIWGIGRERGIFANILTHGKLFFKTKSISPRIVFFEDIIKKTLQDHFKDLEKPARNAELLITDNLLAVIIPEERGIVPDYDLAIEELRKGIFSLSHDALIVHAKEDIPAIIMADLAPKKKEIEILFTSKATLTFRYNDKTWAIDKNVYKDWIAVTGENLAFTDGLAEYIKKKIAPQVEESAQEARFQLTEARRVVEFKPSREGRRIAYDATVEQTTAAFFHTPKNDPIDIITEQVFPEYTTESVNTLGIKEIIGQGVSRFDGSPQNRRHNIKIGADTLNGILIPPGEEFSLVKALGQIDGEHGYLPELVIKGNRTIPEYGGGLCQIGTTLFRGALSSGLPITERRAHSYRVRYYEPAGTDCTIYPPHPDCKFFNDTGSHILLQTRMTDKDELIFEFWGAKDGRKVTQTEPIIYDVAKPPSTLFVETDDIPEGEKKCTERAHDGAKTKFDYKVEYPDGTVKEQSFLSAYKPWQAVCLIGKKKTATSETDL